VDLTADFSTNVNDSFVNSIMPTLLQNLMDNNNSVEVGGVKYSASMEMVFEGDVPLMNGTLISAGNVTACVYHIFVLLICHHIAAIDRQKKQLKTTNN